MAARDIYRYSAVDNRPPYASLAPLYDRVMAHVEYHSWLELINSVLKHYSSAERPRFLELGGGTGILGARLKQSGYSYFGCDCSFAMCAQARNKNLPFFCSDARHMPINKSFDIALFLYDGINYLTGPSDYDRLLSGLHPCLENDGLFLFDITTEANSLKHFYNFLDFEDFGDYTYVRHSYYEPKSKNQYNDFTIFASRHNNGGSQLYEKHCERHVQLVLSVEEIKARIAPELFEIVGIWDGFTFKRYTSRSERIHFLLRKRAQ